jgi:hypothetical protein
VKYREWVPRALREWHAEVKNNPKADPTYLDTIDRLVRREEMQTVWPTLIKRHEKEELIKQRGLDSDRLIRIFVSYVHSLRLGPSSWDRATDKQRRDQTSEIISTARKLARLIAPTPYDHVVGAYAAQVGVQKRKDLSELHPFSLLHTDQPRVTQLLTVLADIVEDAEVEPSTLPRPNRDDAHCLYFVRGLSQHLQIAYEKSLHSVVADTASAVLDMSVDEDYVRRNTKNLIT